MTKSKSRKLSELDYGETGRITKINGNLKGQISAMGIREGKELRMDTKQPINGPVVITIEKSTTSLGFNLAEKITVEVDDDHPADGTPERR